MTDRPVAVIAGNYRQYVAWCRENDCDPRGGRAFYATPQSLRGRSGVEVVRTGTWRERTDLAEIGNALRYVNRAG